MQKQFIKYLKAKTQDNTSFVEEIASVLDIGYDAAYRRVNNKTNATHHRTITIEVTPFGAKGQINTCVNHSSN